MRKLALANFASPRNCTPWKSASPVKLHAHEARLLKLRAPEKLRSPEALLSSVKLRAIEERQPVKLHLPEPRLPVKLRAIEDRPPVKLGSQEDRHPRETARPRSSPL